MNIADEATRPKLDFVEDSTPRWLKGPTFLEKDEKYWPAFPIVSDVNTNHEEEKVKTCLLVNTMNHNILNFVRFSSYFKMKRYAAWVLRFIRVYVGKSSISSRELTPTEIEAGEKVICRLVQMETFCEERKSLLSEKPISKSSDIFQLTPYLDDENIIRVNGRIDNAYYLPDSARRPIILPSGHHITKLITSYYHQWRHHQNDHIVMNEIRQKFWIPHIRRVLRSVKKSCPTCIRDSAKPLPPLMGQLKIDRLMPYIRPFSYIGLDYCGPFYVTIGRSRVKIWIAYLHASQLGPCI
ncbi:uncharacterized protein LOC142231077 [Haematobia irritans]|uniref:uncharacterized protein LOC142231077 n=1 Tax=Haematobia irritans TaxID=7368 RepID=UPI003F4FBD04